MIKTKAPRSLLQRLIQNWAVPFGCGLFFLLLFKFVFFIGFVPSASMEPAIKEDSYIFGLRVLGELRHGDVAVFTHSDKMLVKRITGIPGDMVYRMDGEALTVPEGCYFVTGDNEGASIDSQYWDEPFISKNDIFAKIWTMR